MKRKIFETIKMMKKKFVLGVMLAGAAMNTGFTENVEVPDVQAGVQPNVQIEEMSTNEPTAIAVGENGRLQVGDDAEMTRAFLELVEESRQQDISKLAGEETSAIEEISTVEEVQPENVVETSSGYVPYIQMMDMEATAYLPTDGSAEGLTAMGIPATYGIVAVDPDVIPLGSRVYIPGYGEALAADTGGAIYGYKIDLCMENYWQAMDFGRRTITVFVLK